MPETEDVVPIADDACDFAGVLAPRDSVVWSPVPDVQKRVLDPFWSRHYANVVLCLVVVASVSYRLNPLEGVVRSTHGFVGSLLCFYTNLKVLKYEATEFNLLMRLVTVLFTFIWLAYATLNLHNDLSA